MSQLPTLNTQLLWEILNGDIKDDQVNELVWFYLGYRENGGQWDLSLVAEPWAEKYPTPPDFIASRPATVMLTRSIPKENKQLLKEYLGFKGYSIDQLKPTLTRRATAVSWLLSYMHDHGMLESQNV